MKKLFLMLVLVFAGIVSASANPVSIATLVAKTGVEIYNAIPEADYIIRFRGSDGTVITSANSASRAISTAILLLENGAEYVTISSALPTAHKSCRGETYYYKDLGYLRSRE